MKVSIDAGGRKVEIEAADQNLSPADLAAQALSLWQATESAALVSNGPGFGLTQAASGDRPVAGNRRSGHVQPVQASDGGGTP